MSEADNISPKIDRVVLKSNLISPDIKAGVTVYDPKIGQDLYISKWQNESQEPYFVLWPKDAYNWQLEKGYKSI